MIVYRGDLSYALFIRSYISTGPTEFLRRQTIHTYQIETEIIRRVKSKMIIPSDILPLVAHQLTAPSLSTSSSGSTTYRDSQLKTKIRTLSSLSRASKTTHQLLTPLLYRHLVLTQDQLIKLLTYPSDNYALVRSVTLTALGKSFDISSTQAFRFRNQRPQTQTQSQSLAQPQAQISIDEDVEVHVERPLFPNATILKLSDYVDFTPPGFQYLPKLLHCDRLIIDTRVYSWRISCIPPLWHGLEVIELQCRNWTCPFIAPGIHHVIHLSQLGSPFRHPPTPHPHPSFESEHGDEDEDDDVDPDDPKNEAYRHLLETTFRWLSHCVESCAKAELAQNKGLTTWEMRIKVGGRKEIRWSEKRIASMLLDSGLGEGRVEVDDNGEMRLTCLKFVLDKD